MDRCVNTEKHQPALHGLALLTAAATVLLIYIGGQVTTRQAGMSVPDWPNSYGYNMFLFPINKWVGGIFYEHTHRLLATVVGFLAICMTFIAWAPARNLSGRIRIRSIAILSAIAAAVCGLMSLVVHQQMADKIIPQLTVGCLGILACAMVAFFPRNREPRRWVRCLTVAVLGGVVFQGVLGGLRVVLVKLDLAIVHGCVAQAFFCLVTLLAVVTSRWWKNAPDYSTDFSAVAGRRLIVLGIMGFGIVYCQLIVGAIMRHYQAGLAIPDLPLAYGKWLPPTDPSQLQMINQQRIWQMNLPAVSLGQIWLHFGHRMGAIVVSIAVLTLVVTILRNHQTRKWLAAPAWAAVGLLATQVTLGLLTVYFRKPADMTSAHVACGALVLATVFVIAVRAMRLYSLRFRASLMDEEKPFAAEQRMQAMPV